jgi:predicted PurR-regulated permease PerM
LVPELRSSIKLLVDQMPGMLNSVRTFAVETLQLPETWFTFMEAPDIAGILEKLLQSGVIQQVVQSGGSLVGGTVTVVSDVLLGLCFAIYLLFQKEVLVAGCKRLVRAYMKPDAGDRLIYIASSMNEIYSSFISGQCLDAMILGAMVTVTLLIFGVDYALLIGILVAVTALVPVVGAFLGGAIGVFLLLMISFKDAVIFLVAFLVLQTIDNRLVYPHVVGNAVGLPAIWIFAAIIIGGNLGGIFGMIMAIPLFALAYSLIGEDLARREQLQIPETEEPQCEEEQSP